jgi:hypothetical protein
MAKRIYNIYAMKTGNEIERIQAKYTGLYNQFKDILPKRSQLKNAYIKTQGFDGNCYKPDEEKPINEALTCHRWPKGMTAPALLKMTAKKDMDSSDVKYGTGGTEYWDICLNLPHLMAKIDENLEAGKEEFEIELVPGVEFYFSYSLEFNREAFGKDLQNLYTQKETARGINYETMTELCEQVGGWGFRVMNAKKITLEEVKGRYYTSYALDLDGFKINVNAIADDLKARHPLIKVKTIHQKDEE